MLKFKKPEIADKEWVDKCLMHANSMNCEYSFGNVFIWSTAYSTQICHYKDFFICRWGKGKNLSYSIPIGEGDFSDAINQIINDAKSLGIKARIYGITDGYLSMIQEAFTGKFTYENDDAYNDYIYSVDKMSNLSGKKYHGKRNHISKFKKVNPNWTFEMIDESNINECVDMHSAWIANKDDDDEDYSFEFEAVLTAFEHYNELGFLGGLIRVDNKVVAYTMGERLMSGRCFVTHFEKAFADVQGAYPIINQEFTKNCLLEFEFVNREEDLGLEGLRKAKQSYYPEIFLSKSVAIYND